MSLYVSTVGPATRIVTDDCGTVSCAEHVTARIALNLTAPGQARRLLNIALAEWGLGHLADAAEIIMSELVTNALEHGQEPALLNLYTDREPGAGLLFVEVEDAGEHMPAPRDAADDETDGRGLLLVDALAEDWGVEPFGHGKRVWASLAIAEKPGE